MSKRSIPCQTQLDQQRPAEELVNTARADGVDLMGPRGGRHCALSLTARGLTNGEVADWQALDRRVYPMLFIDAISVKVRDGQVPNRAVYSAVTQVRATDSPAASPYVAASKETPA